MPLALTAISIANSRTNRLLNSRCTRLLTRPAAVHESTILGSPRYHQYRHNLYHLVSRPTFAGYWILQSSLAEIRPPCTSDITIFYLHGGSYFSSQPVTYLLFLLRLAESLLDQGLSVSIFAFDYRLAPEHPFPAQMRDATAAYSYLLDEMQIPAEKVFMAGDSAGGHLALSQLMNLKEPFAGSTNQQGVSGFVKPGGLVIMSPWLSLYHEPSSFSRNEHFDVLSGAFLRATAQRFLGPKPTYAKNSQHLEFLSPDPAVDWDDVLPPCTWISTGGA